MAKPVQTRVYRAAVVACGRISRAHARGYLANPNTELAACADIKPEALEAFGSEFNIAPEHRYLDYNEMMRVEKPDIVSICSLHDLHAPMTIDVAAYGPRAILCEKPIALNLGQANAMIDACRLSGTLLVVGHQRRFAAQYVAAYGALESGAIGELQSIETHGHPGCSLMVDGTHTVDLIRWFAGDGAVKWVFAQIDAAAHRSAWGSAVENAALVLFRFGTGVRAVMTLGSLVSVDYSDPLWENVAPSTYHQIILRGASGQIEIDGDAPVAGRPWVRLVRNGAVEGIPVPEFSPHGGKKRPSAHTFVINEIVKSIETGKQHLLDAKSARATLEVLMAAYESSRSRRIIELPLKSTENPLFDMLESGEV